MKVKYAAVNAFTSSPSAGNPAAIVILDACTETISDGTDIRPLFPADTTLQAIATAIDYPMTAFLVPLTGSAGQAASAGETDRYALRWFNPAHEVWICGHATMALSHYLVNDLSSATKKAEGNGSRPAEKAKLSLLTLKYGTVSSIQVVDPWGSGYLTAIDFPQLTTFDELNVDEGRGQKLWGVIEAASKGIGKEDVLDIREDEQRVLVELRSGVDLGAAQIDCTKFVSHPAAVQLDVLVSIGVGYMRWSELTMEDGIAPKYVIPFQIAPSSPTAAYAKGAPHVHSRCFGSGDFAVEDSAVRPSYPHR
jgi:hypothetical protein